MMNEHSFRYSTYPFKAKEFIRGRRTDANPDGTLNLTHFNSIPRIESMDNVGHGLVRNDRYQT